MDSREKIKNYYKRKAENKNSNMKTVKREDETKIYFKDKIILQIVCSVTIVIVFCVALNFKNTKIGGGIVSLTKNVLERNIALNQIESVVDSIKKLGSNIKIVSGDQNKTFIDEDMLKDFEETEKYGGEKK